jgi:MFS family permease
LTKSRIDLAPALPFAVGASGRAAALSTPPTASRSVPPAPSLLRAFRHRNYRLFFGGQSVSLVGTWVTRIATSWLVYRLTGSAWWLGVVGFVGQLPTLLLAPAAGVLVDRWDRHRVLVVTQALSLAQSATLAWLAFSHALTVPTIMALQCAQGLINAIDTPARQAFVLQMVEDRGDLPNAIALNSSMFNGSRLVGPAIGGALLAGAGEAWCFAVDALSYLAVIASLLLMRLPARARPPRARGATAFLGELREGVRYAFGFAPVRALLLIVSLVSMLGMPYSVLMPQIAAGTLHGGPHTLGWLMTAAGAGALTGAAYMATRRTVVGLGRVIALGALGFGASLIAFAFARSFGAAMAILPVVGGTLLVTSSSCNTVLQTILPEALRGRVMALYSTAFLGTAPIGSLLAGALASRIGTAWTIAACGAGCLLTGAWVVSTLPALRALVRPIYRAHGIIPANELPASVAR